MEVGEQLSTTQMRDESIDWKLVDCEFYKYI